jgi:hypothetical protein
MLMESNFEFREKIYRNSLFNSIKLFPKEAGILSTFEENKLNSIVMNSKFHVLEMDESIDLPFGGYIFQGELLN